MTDESPKIHIDSDWKEEAAREKKRLAELDASQKREAPPEEASAGAPSGFLELVNMLAIQVAVGLGGYDGPGGEQIPPNPAAAKHHIDLLGVLEEKTRGNLTDDEKGVLEAVLHELRAQFVKSVNPPPVPTSTKSE